MITRRLSHKEDYSFCNHFQLLSLYLRVQNFQDDTKIHEKSHESEAHKPHGVCLYNLSSLPLWPIYLSFPIFIIPIIFLFLFSLFQPLFQRNLVLIMIENRMPFGFMFENNMITVTVHIRLQIIVSSIITRPSFK